MSIPDLGILIKKTENHLSNEMNIFASQYSLTGVQMSIIDFLGRAKSHAKTQKEIELEFNIQRSTTAIILQRMEKRGLVQRAIDANDRRKRLVKLTPKALELFPVVNNYINKKQKALLEHFTKEQLQTVVEVLNEIGGKNDK